MHSLSLQTSRIPSNREASSRKLCSIVHFSSSLLTMQQECGLNCEVTGGLISLWLRRKCIERERAPATSHSRRGCMTCVLRRNSVYGRWIASTVEPASARAEPVCTHSRPHSMPRFNTACYLPLANIYPDRSMNIYATSRQERAPRVFATIPTRGSIWIGDARLIGGKRWCVANKERMNVSEIDGFWAGGSRFVKLRQQLCNFQQNAHETENIFDSRNIFPFVCV